MFIIMKYYMEIMYYYRKMAAEEMQRSIDVNEKFILPTREELAKEDIL